MPHCNAVASSHDQWLMRYSILAVALWLPTERVLLSTKRPTNNLGRGPSCKLCGGEEETNEHALSRCPHPTLVRLRESTTESAMRVISQQLVTSADGSSSEPPRCFGLGHLAQAWFDPSGSRMIRIYPLVSADTVRALVTDSPSTWAAVMGFGPIALGSILRWECHADGGWRDRGLVGTRQIMSELHSVLAQGSLRSWVLRCRAMDRWWRSAAASEALLAIDENSAERASARALVRAKKNAPLPLPPRTAYAKARPVRSRTQAKPFPFVITDTSIMDADIAYISAADRARWNSYKPRWF
jgi:hypothetical protein